MIKNYKLELVMLFVLCFPCIFNAMNNDVKTQNVVVVLRDPEFPDHESFESSHNFIIYNTQPYKDQNEEWRKQHNLHIDNALLYKDPYFMASQEEILEYWKDKQQKNEQSYYRPISNRFSSGFQNYMLFASKIKKIKRVLAEEKLEGLKKILKQIKDKMIEIVGEQIYGLRHKNSIYSTLMFFEISKDQKEQLSKIEGVSNVFFAKNVKWDELKQFRDTQKKSLLEIESKQFNDAREKSFIDDKK